jgi:hypothetical protein
MTPVIIVGLTIWLLLGLITLLPFVEYWPSFHEFKLSEITLGHIFLGLISLEAIIFTSIIHLIFTTCCKIGDIRPFKFLDRR